MAVTGEIGGSHESELAGVTKPEGLAVKGRHILTPEGNPSRASVDGLGAVAGRAAVRGVTARATTAVIVVCAEDVSRRRIVLRHRHSSSENEDHENYEYFLHY
jgi:hypothetical protein